MIWYYTKSHNLLFTHDTQILGSEEWQVRKGGFCWSILNPITDLDPSAGIYLSTCPGGNHPTRIMASFAKHEIVASDSGIKATSQWRQPREKSVRPTERLVSFQCTIAPLSRSLSHEQFCSSPCNRFLRDIPFVHILYVSKYNTNVSILKHTCKWMEHTGQDYCYNSMKIAL